MGALASEGYNTECLNADGEIVEITDTEQWIRRVLDEHWDLTKPIFDSATEEQKKRFIDATGIRARSFDDND